MEMKNETRNTVITIEQVGEDRYSTIVHGDADRGLLGDILTAALCDNIKKLAKERNLPLKAFADAIIYCLQKELQEEPTES